MVLLGIGSAGPGDAFPCVLKGIVTCLRGSKGFDVSCTVLPCREASCVAVLAPSVVPSQNLV